MKVVKYHAGSREELAVFQRVMDDPSHRFHGHMLVSRPVEKPDRKRESAWVDLKTVRIDWIRDFLEVNDVTGLCE